jgi:hypothetical protein
MISSRRKGKKQNNIDRKKERKGKKENLNLYRFSYAMRLYLLILKDLFQQLIRNDSKI